MEIIKNLEEERVVKIIVEETRNVERKRIIEKFRKHKKRDGNLISINETVILIKNIVEITVEGGLFGDGLLFKTTGGRIKIYGFNKNDIKTIVRLVHLCNK